MHIIHSHVWSWPEVRRGAERELRELALRQAALGNDVQVVSGTSTGLVSRDTDGPLRITRVRVPSLRRLSPEATWAGSALPALAASRGDLLHAWHYGDGAAATLVRRGRPLVLKVTGCVPRDSSELRRPDRALLHRALEGASEVWVNDDWVVSAMAGWGVPMVVVPPGVDTDHFAPGGTRAQTPTVLAVGPVAEGRKRLRTLVSWWPSVVDQVPEATLRIAGAASELERSSLLELLPAQSRSSVELLGSLGADELVAAYRDAWVLAAPAGDEAFGLAVVESLATGTPVVGIDTGATPGLLAAGADLGSVHGFDDREGFAAALVDRLRRAPSATESADRAADVAVHSWGQRVTQVQERYAALLR